MLPARRGDGTGLSVPGFSEVRKGDGTVLWSSGGGGSAIPDSVVHQYLIDESTGTTLTDTEGTEDITTNFQTWVSDAEWEGGFAQNSDGVGDEGIDGTMGDFWANSDTDFALEITFSTTDTGENALLGAFDSGGTNQNMAFWVQFGTGGATSDQLAFNLRGDSSDGAARLTLNTTTAVNDGSRYHIIYNKRGNTAADVDLRVNGVEDGAVDADALDPTTLKNLEADMAYFARNVRGSTDAFIDAEIASIRWYNDSLTESQMDSLYSRQAWSDSGGGTPSVEQLSTDGVWTYFQTPRAVYEPTPDKTFTGYVDTQGQVQVFERDHGTETDAETQIFDFGTQDDHHNPSFHTRADDKLIAFWGRHDTDLKYKITQNAYDTTSWQATQTLSTTGSFSYPKPAYLSAEDSLYVFYRSDPVGSSPHRQERFRVSSDDGDTWGAEETLIDFTGRADDPWCYSRIDVEGTDTIHFAISPDAREGADGVAGKLGIYYLRYTDGAYYRADGTQIGTDADRPFTLDDIETVWDGINGDPAWIVGDITTDNGNPVITFTSYPAPDDHRHQYAKWNGSSWDINEVAVAGPSMIDGMDNQAYSGGIVLDHSDPSRVYYGAEVTDTFQIFEATTTDGGVTWDATQLTDSADSNSRPIAVRGSGAPIDPIWFRGVYNGFTDYDTAVYGYNQ